MIFSIICVLGCIIAVPTETAAIAPPPTTPPPPFVPDCSTCEYFSGIGYVPDPIYCCKYYVVRYKYCRQYYVVRSIGKTHIVNVLTATTTPTPAQVTQW